MRALRRPALPPSSPRSLLALCWPWRWRAGCSLRLPSWFNRNKALRQSAFRATMPPNLLTCIKAPARPSRNKSMYTRVEVSMNKLVALGLAAAGGVMAFRALPHETRLRLTAPLRRRISQHMQQMMASLPDDAPPKLVASILPKLQAQNDQIIAMLREQNQLLREQQRRVAAE